MQVKLHAVRIELGHLRSFSYQAVQAVGFFVDDRQQFFPLRFVNRSTAEQEVTEAFTAVNGVRNS